MPRILARTSWGHSYQLWEPFNMGFEFGAVLAFLVVSICFAFVALTISGLVRPRFPSATKATIYECGEQPIGRAWMNFNPRFYLIALVFVIFEVDIALTFPVVAVFREWVERSPTAGFIALGELLLFTLILVVGLVWVWVHRDLEWVKRLRTTASPGPRPSGKRAA